MVCSQIDAARVAPESRPPQSGCRVVTNAVLPAEEAMPTDAPKIDDAPGLTWRRVKDGWIAYWQARTDLVKRGFPISLHKLWDSRTADAWRKYIQDFCTTMQAEMHDWARTDAAKAAVFCGTLGSLIACYRHDPDSSYRTLRYVSRKNYDNLLDRLHKEYGDTLLKDINARLLKRWHEGWTPDGKLAMGHAILAMMRTLFTFGKTILEDAECERIKSTLHDLRFPMSRPRVSIVTVDHVVAIRRRAREIKRPSMALAQAFQFECTLRQKDVIGEWVPTSEPGVSDVHYRQEKWLRGLRWSEIDADLILRHTTSKKLKDIEVNLRFAPMVLEELALAYPGFATINASTGKPIYDRSALPLGGPIIVHDKKPRPYRNTAFRRLWREIANDVGVPAEVFNMDNRAGAISEATDSGADLESVRHAAAHSNISMTQRYSRNSANKIADTMSRRAAKRTTNTTD
jgi:hypothetical protein